MTERLAEVPVGLRARVLDAVRQTGVVPTGGGEDESGGASSAVPHSASDVSRSLREVAERLLVSTRSEPPTRDTALTLLAADALITLAMEAELGRGEAATA